MVSVVLSGSRCFSLVLIDYHGVILYVVIGGYASGDFWGYLWFSVVTMQWLLVVLNGCQWLSVVTSS